MSANTAGIFKLRVTRYFDVSRRARVRFGRLDKRAADIPALHGRLDVPALDKRHWRRRAAWRVCAVVQFQEANEAALDVGHEHNRQLEPVLEIVARLEFVIREGTRPERIAQTRPVGSIVLDNRPDFHRGSAKGSRE